MSTKYRRSVSLSLLAYMRLKKLAEAEERSFAGYLDDLIRERARERDVTVTDVEIDDHKQQLDERRRR
jgi:hypothetical protein